MKTKNHKIFYLFLSRVHIRCIKILLYIVFLFPLNLIAQTNNDSFIRGVDISFTPQIEDLGGNYRLNGVVQDVLDIFKASGVNYVRLRLWYAPAGGYCGLAKTLAYAKRIKARGFKFLLDFHYSDTWADPGHQTKPAAWTNLSFSSLQDSVYAYTKNVIAALKNQNTLPDMVQIGNEVTAGILWPDGNNSTPNGWTQFGQLIKKGIAGVKDASGTTPVKIMIHIDHGENNSASRWFFDNFIGQGINFDVIGLSFYPFWGGTFTNLQNNINDLSTRYNKEIVIVETAYPWTLQYQDTVRNVVGLSSQLLSGYPATVKGQNDYLIYLYKLIKGTTNGKGVGFFYWEPAYISVPPIGSTWENLTTFSFSDNTTHISDAQSSINAFQDLDSLTDIKSISKTIPAEFQLYQNYPNPFNPSTVIRYELPASGYVTLKIYDMLGREVATLINGYKPAGSYSYEFSFLTLSSSKSGKSSESRSSSGIYFYKLTAGSLVQIKKMVFMK